VVVAIRGCGVEVDDVLGRPKTSRDVAYMLRRTARNMNVIKVLNLKLRKPSKNLRGCQSFHA